MSRQPLWDTACKLQADMFREAAAIGGLDVQLVYFRGLAECRASRWVSDARQLAALMEKIDCRGGHTQIGKVLAHTRRETEQRKVQALVMVGDAMEEPIDDLCAVAGALGLLGVPAFVFQEGYDPIAERAFREIARSVQGCLQPLRSRCRASARRIAARGGRLCGRRHEGARQSEGQRHRRETPGAVAIAMPTLVFGILVLVLVLWALNAYSKADPKMLAKLLPSAGGIGALALAGFLGFRGHMETAIPLGLFGLGMLGWGPFAATGIFKRTQKTPGQTSRVRSAFVEMELDHDSGAMIGRILAGPHEGKSLDALDVPTLLGLLPQIDEESRALLAAYLDRREPSWRENAQSGSSAGNGATRIRENDGGGGLSDPWRESGRERRRDRPGPPDADEETASRPGGVDVPRGPDQ